MNALSLLARLALGATFVWLGLAKLGALPEFLKAIREYHLVDHGRAMTFVAATLPWVEVFGGALLLLGVAVRGLSLVFLAVLAAVTFAIAQRGLDVAAADGIAFCAVAFDCGCGTGVENVCRKLSENGALMVCALLVLFSRGGLRFGLRPRLLGGRAAPA
ncbi:MAG: MauE/DoxX family redox-associated membrane protein [Planctomycetota bacterium JB042]